MVPKFCSTEACVRPMHARTFCELHYSRFMNAATLEMPPAAALEARFWAFVDKSGKCWEWTGGRHPFGYGKLRVNRRYIPAHRISYEMTHGPISDGLVIDHICHNPPCVNPSHLRAVTQKRNAENRAGAQANSKSGVRGIYQAPSGRWRAELQYQGVKVKLGTFDSKEDATAAVIARRNELFTCNSADRRTN